MAHPKVGAMASNVANGTTVTVGCGTGNMDWGNVAKLLIFCPPRTIQFRPG